MPLRFITHVAFQLPGLSGKRLIDTDGVIRGPIFVVFYGPGGGEGRCGRFSFGNLLQRDPLHAK